MIFTIILFIIFICLSAFFSASETAVFSLSASKLRRLQEGYPQAKTVKGLLNHPARTLSALVFGNMMVNIGFSSLAAATFVSVWGPEGGVLAIVLSGVIILLFGEIFPKTLAIYRNEQVSLSLAPLLVLFSRIFLPVIFLMEKTVKFFSSFLLRYTKAAKVSDEELRTALLLGRREGHITEEEEEMISYVLEFKDTWVSEILTARIDIQGIDSRLAQEEVVKTLQEKKHSKFPVYDNSLDNIIGILYAKDVFLNPDKSYRQLLRQPLFVPESQRIDDLLKLFLEKKERIAVILDEYGGTEGLVTLEDIQEEIFGEIYDEFEVPKRLIEEIEGGRWRVFGKTPIKTVNAQLDLSLPEEEATLAGFLLSQMEKIPRPQEEFTFGGVGFTIERATAKRIVSVILCRRDKTGGESRVR